MPAVLEGATPALEDALMVDDAKKRRLTRRKSRGGGRGSATPGKETEAGACGDAVSRAGSKKKPAAFCKSTTQPMGIIIKQCLRTKQETRSLCGAIFGTIITATEHDVVKSMREQTRRYNEWVQAAGKGHTLGPPQIWAWGGLIAGLQKQRKRHVDERHAASWMCRKPAKMGSSCCSPVQRRSSSEGDAMQWEEKPRPEQAGEEEWNVGGFDQ